MGKAIKALTERVSSFSSRLCVYGDHSVREKRLKENRIHSFCPLASTQPQRGGWCSCSCVGARVNKVCVCCVLEFVRVRVYKWECLWFRNSLMEYCSQLGSKLISMIKTQSTSALSPPRALQASVEVRQPDDCRTHVHKHNNRDAQTWTRWSHSPNKRFELRAYPRCSTTRFQVPQFNQMTRVIPEGITKMEVHMKVCKCCPASL